MQLCRDCGDRAIEIMMNTNNSSWDFTSDQTCVGQKSEGLQNNSDYSKSN